MGKDTDTQVLDILNRMGDEGMTFSTLEEVLDFAQGWDITPRMMVISLGNLERDGRIKVSDRRVYQLVD